MSYSYPDHTRTKNSTAAGEDGSGGLHACQSGELRCGPLPPLISHALTVTASPAHNGENHRKLHIIPHLGLMQDYRQHNNIV